MKRQAFDTEERRDIAAEFRRVVNMTPSALKRWLASEESRSVGITSGGEEVTGEDQHESVGHHMGERIIEIKSRKASELSEDDYRDMRKVVGYVHRHLAQRPGEDVSNTRWCKSLMNWGHDPMKDAAE